MIIYNIYIYIHIYVYIYIYVHVYTYTDTRTYIHTHIHTHTHTYRDLQFVGCVSMGCSACSGTVQAPQWRICVRPIIRLACYGEFRYIINIIVY